MALPNLPDRLPPFRPLPPSLNVIPFVYEGQWTVLEQLAHLRAYIKWLIECVKEFEKWAGEHDNELEQVHNTINQILDNLSELDNRITNIESEIEGLDNRISVIEQNINEINVQISAINNSINSINLSITNLVNKLNTVENNITNLNTEIDNIREQVDNINDIIGDVTDLSQLEAQVQTNTSDIASIKTVNQKQDSDIEAIKTVNQRQDNDISTNTTNISKNTTNIQTIQTKQNTLEAEIFTNTGDIAEIKDNYVKKVGDTMTGTLGLPRINFSDGTSMTTAPRDSSDDISDINQEISNIKNDYVKKTGDTMTGDLNISGARLLFSEQESIYFSAFYGNDGYFWIANNDGVLFRLFKLGEYTNVLPEKNNGKIVIGNSTLNDNYFYAGKITFKDGTSMTTAPTGGGGAGDYVSKSGDTMTGDLLLDNSSLEFSSIGSTSKYRIKKLSLTQFALEYKGEGENFFSTILSVVYNSSSQNVTLESPAYKLMLGTTNNPIKQLTTEKILFLDGTSITTAPSAVSIINYHLVNVRAGDKIAEINFFSYGPDCISSNLILNSEFLFENVEQYDFEGNLTFNITNFSSVVPLVVQRTNNTVISCYAELIVSYPNVYLSIYRVNNSGSVLQNLNRGTYSLK